MYSLDAFDEDRGAVDAREETGGRLALMDSRSQKCSEQYDSAKRQCRFSIELGAALAIRWGALTWTGSAVFYA